MRLICRSSPLAVPPSEAEAPREHPAQSVAGAALYLRVRPRLPGSDACGLPVVFSFRSAA